MFQIFPVHKISKIFGVGFSNIISILLNRSNYVGTKFVIYDGLPPHAGAKMMKSRSFRLGGPKQVFPGVSAGNYPVAHISYKLNVLGSR